MIEIGSQSSQTRFAFEDVSMESRRITPWQGTASEVLDSMAQPVNGEYGAAWLGANFWHPSRVARAVIDYATGDDRVELVTQATQFAVRAYAGELTKSDITTMDAAVASRDIDRRDVTQLADDTTWRATAWGFSRDSARRLTTQTNGESIFMVPICHGGLVAGIQTGLFYARECQADVGMFPVRYSRSTEKHNDLEPQLDDASLEHIAARSADQPIVVFDEDAFGGHSVGRVVDALRPISNRVPGIVNYDRRIPLTLARQGEWWDIYDPMWDTERRRTY